MEIHKEKTNMGNLEFRGDNKLEPDMYLNIMTLEVLKILGKAMDFTQGIEQEYRLT